MWWLFWWGNMVVMLWFGEEVCLCLVRRAAGREMWRDRICQFRLFACCSAARIARASSRWQAFKAAVGRFGWPIFWH